MRKLNNTFNDNWIEILTQNKPEKIEEFNKIVEKSPSVELAIMKYRKLEQDRGRTQHIKFINHTNTIQQLFLEPITTTDIQLLHSKFKAFKMDLSEGYDKIYQMHQQDKGKRFIYLVNSL